MYPADVRVSIYSLGMSYEIIQIMPPSVRSYFVYSDPTAKNGYFLEPVHAWALIRVTEEATGDVHNKVEPLSLNEFSQLDVPDDHSGVVRAGLSAKRIRQEFGISLPSDPE